MLDKLLGPRDAPLNPAERGLARATVYLLLFSLIFPFLMRYLFLGVVNLPKMQGFAESIGMAPQNAAAFLAVSILYLWSRPNQLNLQLTALLCLLAEAAYLYNLPETLNWYQKLLSVGGGIGLATLIGLAIQAISDPSEPARQRARISLRVGIIVVLFPLFMGALLGLLSNFTPLVYDGFGFVVEGSAGFYPSVEVARFLATHKWAFSLMVAIYTRLPIFVLFALILSLHRPADCHFNLFSAFVLSGLIVFPFYYLLPMVGIDYFLGSKYFPLGEIPVYTTPEPVPSDPRLPRSCTPSIHATSILMAYWAVRSFSPALKKLYAFLVITTLIAALGPNVGHYAIDFVGAFPYTLGCIAFCCKDSPQRSLTYCYAIGIAAFFTTAAVNLTIRWYATSLAAYPLITWSMYALIIGACFYLESELSRRWRDDTTDR